MALDPVIHQPTRLHLLAALHRNRELTFRELREGVGLTAGNLGSHLARLEDVAYVAARHVLRASGVEMAYRITAEGDAALKAYLAELRTILDSMEADEPTPPPSASTRAP